MITHVPVEATEASRNKRDAVLRIAYLATPVEFGGSEKVSLTFLQNFQHEKILLHPILLVRPWETDNLFINELKAQGMRFSLVPTRNKPREQGGDYFRLFRSAKIIYQEIKDGKFDLIHSNGYFADILGMITAKLLRIPIVSTCHGFIFNSKKLALYNTLDVYTLRYMSGIVAVSADIQNQLVKQGVSRDRIHVVQNAVRQLHDRKWKEEKRRNGRYQYGVKETEILIGYVGRLSDEKGVQYLLEAATELARSKVPFRLLIIGDGPKRKELEHLVKNATLESQVIFTGFLQDPTQILPALDIFTLPSLTEGTSMALLEAMSCGLAVVATGVGGTPTVISNSENGVIVPPANSRALYREMLKLIEDETLRKRLGVEAEKTIEKNFSLSNWVTKIESIYTNVIDQSRLSSR